MPHVIVSFMTAVVAAFPTSEVQLPGSLDLEKIRALPLQHDGRWPPLDTVARHLVEEVTGNSFYQGRDPVLWLLAWNFDPATWMQQPLLGIENAELRQELHLPPEQTVYSYAELVNHQRLRSLTMALANIEKGRKMNPLESKVSEINGRLNWLDLVFRGDALKMIPNSKEALGRWQPIMATAKDAPENIKSLTSAWASLGEAFLADNAPGFAAASERVVSAAAALPAVHRPTQRVIGTELRYNRLSPFRSAWIVMAVGAFLSAVALIVRRKWFDLIAIAGLVAGFAMITYGLSLRWAIAGRIPAANMYESLLFLGWGMGAFAIVAMFALRYRIVPLTASAMGALSLALADLLPLDSFVRPAVPVLLDTIWMSIHVPIIMVSYSVLALGVLFAHVQVAGMALAPKQRQFAAFIDSLHYWYILVGSLLLLAGIITGSMWAASSWGRYWGWDPKEVWSLVAFVGYMAVLHVRVGRERIPWWGFLIGAGLAVALFVLVVPKLGALDGTKLLIYGGVGAAMVLFVLGRGPFAIAVKSIVCFWLVIMTYVGVNYILGIGLHSYGFGTGAMTTWMFRIGGLDLAFVLLLSLIYIARRPALPAPAIDEGMPQPA